MKISLYATGQEGWKEGNIWHQNSSPFDELYRNPFWKGGGIRIYLNKTKGGTCYIVFPFSIRSTPRHYNQLLLFAASFHGYMVNAFDYVTRIHFMRFERMHERASLHRNSSCQSENR